MPYVFLLLLRLVHTAVGDGGWARLADGTVAGTAKLNALYHAHGRSVTIWHAAEDNVAAVQPGSHHGRDEELRAIGVRSGVSHGEEEGLGVLELEVLVCELLAVDGLSARALHCISVAVITPDCG